MPAMPQQLGRLLAVKIAAEAILQLSSTNLGGLTFKESVACLFSSKHATKLHCHPLRQLNVARGGYFSLMPAMMAAYCRVITSRRPSHHSNQSMPQNRSKSADLALYRLSILINLYCLSSPEAH